MYRFIGCYFVKFFFKTQLTYPEPYHRRSVLITADPLPENDEYVQLLAHNLHFLKHFERHHYIVASPKDPVLVFDIQTLLTEGKSCYKIRIHNNEINSAIIVSFNIPELHLILESEG